LRKQIHFPYAPHEEEGHISSASQQQQHFSAFFIDWVKAMLVESTESSIMYRAMTNSKCKQFNDTLPKFKDLDFKQNFQKKKLTYKVLFSSHEVSGLVINPHTNKGRIYRFF
jgi:hypothetical protein